MGLISVVWGIVAMLWMLLALVPLLGWGNWFLIPFAAVGVIIAAIGVVFSRSRPSWPRQDRAGAERAGDRGRDRAPAPGRRRDLSRRVTGGSRRGPPAHRLDAGRGV